MLTENTKSRLKYLMDTQGLRQIDIVNKCQPFCKKYGVKMNKSDISQYVAGKVEPSQSKLVILGMALNVSEAWLMGYDVQMERQPDNPKTKLSNILDDEKLHLIALYEELNDKGREILIETADALVSSNKYKKCNISQAKKQT